MDPDAETKEGQMATSTKSKKSTGRKVTTTAKAKRAAKRPGGFGPKYTPAQIKKGVKLAKAGKLTQVQIAEECGVKSPSYFSKVVAGAR
jgi:hypothetical protein